VADGVRQQFTGHEQDSETGLDFAQARYYSSIQGRFTSPDGLLESARLSQPQSWNRYSYVLNNPLRLVDSTGQEEEDVLYIRTIKREYEFTLIQTDDEGTVAYAAQVKVQETETQIVNQAGDVLNTTTEATVNATNIGIGYNNFSTTQLRNLEGVTKDIVEVSRNKRFDPTIALGIAAEETRLGTSDYILPANRGRPEKLPANNPMQLSGSSNLPVTTDRRANIAGAIDVFNGFASRRGGDLDRTLQGFVSGNYPNAPGVIKGFINSFRGDIARTIKQTHEDRALSRGFKR
jgi:RHS repeat-associated protein